MPRKAPVKKDKEIDFQRLLQEVGEDLFGEEAIASSFGNFNTVDIITFRKEIIGLDNSDYPYMDIVLKMFYSKTYGNEHLDLTDEDINLIKNIKNYTDVDGEDRATIEDEDEIDEFMSEAEIQSKTMIQEMIEQWGGDYWLGPQIENLRNSDRNPFNTLVLALGRRSGKSFLAALIAAYETYKLLTVVTCMKCQDVFNKKSGSKCPRCGKTLINHPQSYYKLKGTDSLFIIMSSTSTKQARDNMLDKFYGLMITQTEWFKEKYLKDDQTGEVYFKSEYDEKYNEEQYDLGQPAFKGSIRVMLAGANAKAQHGRGSVLTIFDEFDLFNVEGVDTDKAVIEALLPASAKYRQTRGDGRIVAISMPGEKIGSEFQKRYKMGTDITNKNFSKVLVFQMPTWEYNVSLPKKFIVDNFAEEFGGDASSAKFHRVFGAQFTKGGVDVFVPEKYIKMATSAGLYMCDKPQNRNHRYFMHVDCSGTGSCNYAYLIGHWEYDQVKRDKVFHEDRSFYWYKTDLLPGKFIGSDGKTYDIEQLLDEIIRVSKVFRISILSYDNMQSQESIYRFRKNGINLKNITFSKSVKSKVYQLLEELLLSEKVKLCCDDSLLLEELKNLRRAPMSPGTRGLHVVVPEDSEIQTMDLVDSLGGAIFSSYELPFGKTRSIYARAVNTAPPYFQSSQQGINASGSINNRGGSIFDKNPQLFNF